MPHQYSRRALAFVVLFGVTVTPGCADDAAPGLRASLVGMGPDTAVSGQDAATGCTYRGRSYAIGDEFHDALRCNACQCSVHGVSCDERYCDPAEACTLGDRQIASGNSVPCADGCNTCLCTSGDWSSTDAACGPLPKVSLCSDEAPRGFSRVEVIYRSDDALALRVGMGGCGGTTPGFKLCWDGDIAESFPVQMRLRVMPDEITACSSWVTQPKVFDLSPLREAYARAYQTETGSIRVNLDGDSVLYSF